jgi:NADH-quinone oxidoreductase subunit J
VLAAAFFAEIGWALSRVRPTPLTVAGNEDGVSSVRQIGIELFTTHAFAFEVTSVLILVAMVGAVVLAKRNI